jgi:DNA repair photolyase
MRRSKEDFHCEPVLKKDWTQKLAADCKKMHEEEDKRRVLFSFATDPFQNKEVSRIHVETINILQFYSINATFLTKAGMMASEALRMMSRSDNLFTFGQSVSFSVLNDHTRMAWEPNASSIHERLRAFKLAKEYGIPTWCSMEPVIDPEDALIVIQEFHPWVDHFKIGKWNYDPRANEIDWHKFVYKAKTLLDELKADYKFKTDLWSFLPEN